MISLLLIIGWAIVFVVEAIQEYKAKTDNSSFWAYMFQKHFGMLVIGVLLLVLLIFSAIRSASPVDRCPRCGQRWYGNGVCFGCQADLKGYPK